MKKLFKGVGYVFLALIVLAVIGAVFGEKDSGSGNASSSQSSSATTQPASPDVTVTAATLFKDYTANEVSADQKYKGKLLAVTGTVQSIDKDTFSNIVIQLKSANEFMPVRAYLNDEHESLAASLQKGEKISWQCKGDGFVIGSPVLRDCNPA